jgi:hypothetical protein
MTDRPGPSDLCPVCRATVPTIGGDLILHRHRDQFGPCPAGQVESAGADGVEHGLWRGCSVPGCGKPHDSHGLCGMHAKRMQRTGSTDPRPVGAPLKPIAHGTHRGAFSCLYRYGEMCEPCRDARADYKRERRRAIREQRHGLVRRAVQRQQQKAAA